MFVSTELDYTDLYLSHFIYISLLGETEHAMLTSLMIYSIQRIGECPLLMFLSHSAELRTDFGLVVCMHLCHIGMYACFICLWIAGCGPQQSH